MNEERKRDGGSSLILNEISRTSVKENDDTTNNVKPLGRLGGGPRVTINDLSDAADKKRNEPKLAYGRAPKIGDVNDRVHSLERENLKLKAKENLLELEIKK
jgi:hypothetical protein